MATKLRPFPNIIIVGAGGVGSYLLPALLRSIRNHAKPEQSPLVKIYDGDKLEDRNMERQLFDNSDIGKHKSVALAAKYSAYYPNLVAVPQFFSGQEEVAPGTLIIAMVDNHPGRVRILSAADLHNCPVLMCGNGYTDAEAFFYQPVWKDSPLDPRVYYPDILAITEGDPLRPEGCTGAAQVATPQLAIANFMAAGYALHLMWFWFQEEHAVTPEFKGYNPILSVNNFSRCSTKTVKNLKDEHAQKHKSAAAA